jgi:hypothetical protein
MNTSDARVVLQNLFNNGFTLVAPCLKCNALLDQFYEPDAVLAYLKEKRKARGTHGQAKK